MLVAALCTAALSACGGGSSSSTTPAAAPTPTPTATPAPLPTLIPVPTPPSLAAPLIIQVENLDAARPQSGLNGADLVYEYETEGGISRFSAFFFKPPATAVGPVRSARLATIKLLRIYEATLLYSGASNYVSAILSRMRAYNETSARGALFRISSRFAPHNLFSDGPHVAALEQRVAAGAVDYQLWARTDPAALPAGGTPAARFSVPVSASERPVFTYDPAHRAYTRTEPGTGLLRDAGAGVPWEPATVVVLQVPVSVGPEVEDVSGTRGLDFGVVGSGAGQVLVGGQAYDITYTQGATGPPKLSLAGGQPAPLAPGQVLICLVRTGLRATAV